MCSIAARISANRSELAVHDVRVDEPERGMLEGFWKAANDVEAKLLPEPDGALVRADHKIKLHGAEAALPRMLQGVRAHRAGYAAARRVRRSHVSAIRNVCAAAFLIGFQEIDADNVALVFRDKNFVAGREPVGQSVFAVQVPRQGISFARAEDRFQDQPDRIGIVLNCFANQQVCILPRHFHRFL